MFESATLALFTIIVGLTVWLVGDYVFDRLKRRKVIKQIHAGTVPVDYKEVARIVAEMNSEDSIKHEALGDFKTRQRAGDLKRIRYKVARIRDNGYVAGHSASSIEAGLARNPHTKGSGEAKQWVRGFCMGYSKPGNIVNPAKWMKRA